MNLSPMDVELFYKIWYTLIWSINKKHKIVPKFKKPVYGENVKEEPFIAVRAELWENPQWIDEFLHDSDDNDLTETECSILADWRNHFIKGRYIVIKHLSKYSVFMSVDNLNNIYGVCGISNPIKETVHNRVPFMVEAVLLPFKDRVIFDSFIGTFGVSFGKGSRDELLKSYGKTKEKIGIIENMREAPVPVRPPVKKAKPQKPNMSTVDTRGVNVPKAMFERYMEVAEIIESFCDEKLNAEYKEICLRALQKMCRKRPSPLAAGKTRTWACGIVYAIGSNNFVFDKSQPINMTATEIADWFGLSKGTAGSKAAEIRKSLNLSYVNTEFMLKRYIKSNPMIWYLNVDGYMVDIRKMPLEVQAEAFRKGLIPYIPAHKEDR